MHRANLNDMARLFALQYAVSTTSGHSRNVQKLGTVDHVIVCSSLACRFSRIGLAGARVIEAIVKDENRVLPITSLLAGGLALWCAFRFDLEA